MVPINVPGSSIEGFRDLLRASETFIGCSVTFPHKQSAFEAADRLTKRARRFGAVNTLRRDADGTLHGDATDELALALALEVAGATLAGRSAHIVGAWGCAGRAIADVFCMAGCHALRL